MNSFGDVGCMIAHALEIFGAKKQMSAERHFDGVFHHPSEEISKEACTQPIDILVPRPNIDRQPDIAGCESIEHIMQLRQHKSGQVAHPTYRPLRQVFSTNSNDALADILGKIACTLNLGGNSQDRKNLAKITSNRLAPNDSLNDPHLNAALQVAVTHREDLCEAAIFQVLK